MAPSFRLEVNLKKSDNPPRYGDFPVIPNGGRIEGSPTIFNKDKIGTDDSDVRIDATEIILGGEVTTYRAVMNMKSVVVKLATGESIGHLASQAQAYGALKSLQGSYIPILYGVFEGEAPIPSEKKHHRKNTTEGEGGQRKVLCMVLEDCGSSLRSLDGLVKTDRQKILIILGNFHRLGYIPDQFHQDHLLRGAGGEIRTIGFRELEQHSCNFTKWRFNRDEEAINALECDILWQNADDFSGWNRYRGPEIRGRLYSGKKYPHQEIVDGLMTDEMISDKNLTSFLEWMGAIKIWHNENLEKDIIHTDEQVVEYGRSLKPAPIHVDD